MMIILNAICAVIIVVLMALAAVFCAMTFLLIEEMITRHATTPPVPPKQSRDVREGLYHSPPLTPNISNKALTSFKKDFGHLYFPDRFDPLVHSLIDPLRPVISNLVIVGGVCLFDIETIFGKKRGEMSDSEYSKRYEVSIEC